MDTEKKVTVPPFTREDMKAPVCEIMQTILEKMNRMLEDEKGLEKGLKILKMDMEDFRDGRLDLILERHTRDPKSYEVSPFKIELKEGSEEKNHWYRPYLIHINDKTYEVNCSVSKDFAVGTYKIGPEKNIVHVRHGGK